MRLYVWPFEASMLGLEAMYGLARPLSCSDMRDSIPSLSSRCLICYLAVLTNGFDRQAAKK